MSTADTLKKQGNDAFQNGDYKEAERLYTRAISKDPTSAIYYTNRAFARIKLRSWDPCIDDCINALQHDANSLKAYFYLATAQLELRHPNEALSSALRSYELCLAARSSSTNQVCAMVLEAKKQKWEVRERERLRRKNPLMVELEEAVRRSGKAAVDDIRERIETGELGTTEGQEEIEETETETRKKVEELRSVFALADPENAKRREVPDWLVDSISFQVMFDPVVTKRGQSYERATIEQHLASSPTDPLTREPLTIDELRPNIALKKACAEFIEENGWAVDW